MSLQRGATVTLNNTTTTTMPPPSTPSKQRRGGSNGKLRLSLIFLSLILVFLLLVSQTVFWTRREDLESAVETALDFANQEIHYIEKKVKDFVEIEDDETIRRRNENRTMQEHGVLVKYAETTIVTAYFQLKSKHSVSSYDNWMTNMLGMQDAMVIFTSPDLVESMQNHRKHALNRTVIISMPLDHLPMAQDYSEEFWKNQLEMDPERHIHHRYSIFWIWLGKSWFVTEAIERNYFSSSIYMWCDIGSFRTKKFREKELVKHAEMVPRNSILFMAHHEPNPPPQAIWNQKQKQKRHFYHSGSHAIGYKDTWRDFHAAFLETLGEFVVRDMFVGEDQAVLQSTCLRKPNSCAYIPFTQVNDNHYWGLRSVLHYGGKYTYWRPPGATLEQEEFKSKQ